MYYYYFYYYVYYYYNHHHHHHHHHHHYFYRIYLVVLSPNLGVRLATGLSRLVLHIIKTDSIIYS